MILSNKFYKFYRPYLNIISQTIVSGGVSVLVGINSSGKTLLKEQIVSPKFKEEFIKSQKEDMILINSPVGLPGRAIKNKFLEDVNKGIKKPFCCPYHCIVTCDFKESAYCIALALANAKRGKFNKGFAFAGKNAYRISKITTVKELIKSLIEEFKAASKNNRSE